MEIKLIIKIKDHEEEVVVDIHRDAFIESLSDNDLENECEHRDIWPEESSLSDWSNSEIISHLESEGISIMREDIKGIEYPIVVLSDHTEQHKQDMFNGICDFLGVNYKTNINSVMELFKAKIS